jgi:hypothetical protein
VGCHSKLSAGWKLLSQSQLQGHRPVSTSSSSTSSKSTSSSSQLADMLCNNTRIRRAATWVSGCLARERCAPVNRINRPGMFRSSKCNNTQAEPQCPCPEQKCNVPYQRLRCQFRQHAVSSTSQSSPRTPALHPPRATPLDP